MHDATDRKGGEKKDENERRVRGQRDREGIKTDLWTLPGIFCVSCMSECISS